MKNKETTIDSKQSVALEVREIIVRRELLYFFTWRNFKIRYKQSLIGAGWAVFRPLILMVVFTFAFHRGASIDSGSEEIPYAIFAYTGLMFWTFFAQAVVQVGDSLVSYQNVIQKIYFPRLIVPLSTALTGLIDFFFASIVFFILALVLDVQLQLAGVVLIFPMLLLTLLTVLGIGLFMASLNVKYRDVRQALPFFVQALLFVTPVIYPITLVSPSYQWILYLNPMTGVVDTMQATLLGLREPNFAYLGISVASCIVWLVIGIAYFSATERRVADII